MSTDVGVGSRWRVTHYRDRIGEVDYVKLQYASGIAVVLGSDGSMAIDETSVTPAAPTVDAQANIYVKSNKLIIQWDDAGTVRYKYLDLTGTGVTWVHATSAP